MTATTELMRSRGDMSLARNEEIEVHNETATAAVQMQMRVTIESRLKIAINFDRKWDKIAFRIEDLCRDPDFAAEALYAKPISPAPDKFKSLSLREKLIAAPEDWPRGFSIRAIEAFIAEAGHFDDSSVIVYDDHEKIITNVVVWDMCMNNVSQRMVVTPKTVERKELKRGQRALETRLNSYGDNLYIVKATAAEVEQTRQADAAKAKRTLGEKMFRADFRRIWRNTIEATLRNHDAENPERAKREILKNFFRIGIADDSIEEYLGHTVDLLQPAELSALRVIYTGIKSSEFTWQSVMDMKASEEDPEIKPTPAAKTLKEKIQKSRTPAAAPKPESPKPAAPPTEPQQTPDEPLPWEDAKSMQAAFVSIQSDIGKMAFNTICSQHHVNFAEIGFNQDAAALYSDMLAKKSETDRKRSAKDADGGKPLPGKDADGRKPLRDLADKYGDLFYRLLGTEYGAGSIDDVNVAHALVLSQEMGKKLADLYPEPEDK